MLFPVSCVITYKEKDVFLPALLPGMCHNPFFCLFVFKGYFQKGKLEREEFKDKPSLIFIPAGVMPGNDLTT